MVIICLIFVLFVAETSAQNVKTTNILADINSRFYAEQDAVLTSIRSEEEQQRSLAERMVLLSQIHLETKVVSSAASFESAALLCGLMERIQTIGLFGERYHLFSPLCYLTFVLGLL